MRYVAKVYVLDWMDQVIVSGYVFDQDAMTNPDHEKWEFVSQIPGTGLNGEAEWLLNSLYRALVAEQRPAPEGKSGPLPTGGLHTISGRSDIGSRVVG
jgi:hypothetical protein